MKAVLLQVCVLLIAGFVMAGDDQDNTNDAPRDTYEIKLVDGTMVEIISYRIEGEFVALVMVDGSKVAFRRGDVVLKTLPSDSDQTAGSDSRARRPMDGDPTNMPDSIGDHGLGNFATGVRLSDDEILIVGDGTLTEVSPSSSFEEQRQAALAQSEDMPAPGLVIKDADSVAGLICKGYEQSLAGPSPIYTDMQCQVIAKAFVKYGKIRTPKDSEVGPGTIIVSIRVSEFGHSISSDVQILRLGPNGYLQPDVVDSFSISGVTGSNGEDVIRFWVRMWQTIDKKYLR